MKLTLHNISTSLSFLPKLNKCIKAETNYNICILINKKKLYKWKERLKNARDSWPHFIFRSGKTYKGTGDVFCLEEEEEDGVRSVVNFFLYKMFTFQLNMIHTSTNPVHLLLKSY